MEKGEFKHQGKTKSEIEGPQNHCLPEPTKLSSGEITGDTTSICRMIAHLLGAFLELVQIDGLSRGLTSSNTDHWPSFS